MTMLKRRRNRKIKKIKMPINLRMKKAKLIQEIIVGE